MDKHDSHAAYSRTKLDDRTTGVKLEALWKPKMNPTQAVLEWTKAVRTRHIKKKELDDETMGEN